MSPPVTVLLPVRNHARFLGAAVGSILSQSFTNFDLLVLDDASTDGSCQSIESLNDPRLRVIRNEEPLGLAATLNRGLKATRAVWIARQDADDLSDPDRFGRQMEFLDRCSDISLLGTDAVKIDAVDRPVGLLRTSAEHESLLFGLLFDNSFVHTSVVFRRDHVLALGGYDVAFDRAQDYDLWVRVASRGSVANLPERLVSRRVGADVASEGEDEYTRPNRAILIRHHLQTLGAAPSDRELALIDAFRRGLTPGEIPAMLDLHSRLVVAFAKRHPAVGQSRDFRRMQAGQFARMALARGNRSVIPVARVLARGGTVAMAGLLEAAGARLRLGCAGGA